MSIMAAFSIFNLFLCFFVMINLSDRILSKSAYKIDIEVDIRKNKQKTEAQSDSEVKNERSLAKVANGNLYI